MISDDTLDRAYFEGLVRRARPLERMAGNPLRDLMADLVDRTNLVWLLRYRLNYCLPPAQVYYLLVSLGYRLHAGELKRLVAQPDIGTVLAALPAAMAQAIGDSPDIPGITLCLEAKAAQRTAQILASSAPPLSRAFAYLLLRERDLRAVRAVLRGRQLRLPTPAIRQALGEAA